MLYIVDVVVDKYCCMLLMLFLILFCFKICLFWCIIVYVSIVCFIMFEFSVCFDLKVGMFVSITKMKLKWALQTCVKDLEGHPFKINTSFQLSLQLHPPFIVDAIMGDMYVSETLYELIYMLLLFLLIKVLCSMLFKVLADECYC